MEMDGFTGMIKFDEDGFRSDIEIDVLEVKTYGLDKVNYILIIQTQSNRFAFSVEFFTYTSDWDLDVRRWIYCNTDRSSTS